MNVSVSQAMACGLPVITTRHSGLPEQVSDGVNGYLVPEGDWQALAAALVRIVRHPELWPAMGAASAARVRKSYEATALLDAQVTLYHELA